MLPIDDTQHDDLRTGRAPWSAGPRAARRRLEQDRRCEVLVVGAGITGALVAERLVREGREVCLVDRERPGLGSTAASTAMLLWEIDRSLARLTELYGFDRAQRAYCASLRAVSGLERLIAGRQIACAFRQRRSLYLAAGSIDGPALLAEHKLRARAGLPGDFLDYRTLRSEFGIDRPAALLSPGSAEADPLCLSHALTGLAIDGGATLYDTNAIEYHAGRRATAVVMEDGHVIEADWVVLATGYVMPAFVPSDLHRVSASWALATPPQPARCRWRDDALIWEASDNYLYLRTTTDHRILVGGADDDTVDPEQRAAATPAKTELLLRGLQELFPQARAQTDWAWSGAFGTTADGLPLIGQVPGFPRILAAYGYGGNGITFGFLAAELIAGLIGGRAASWYDDFAVARPVPDMPG